MRFSRLPTEIQYDVFAKFSAEELCTRVAPVCRRWRQFAYEPALWKDVKLEARKQSPFQMSKILTRSYRIYNLVLSGIKDFSWLKNLPKCESLREIEFSACVISNEALSQFLQIYPYVQCCNYFSTRGSFDSHVKEIVRWKYLTSISLPDLGNNILTLIAENCMNLITMDMNLHNETEESFINFLNLRGPQMQRLTLVGLEHFSSNAYCSLSQCRHLYHLTLLDAKNFSDLNFVRLNELKKLKRFSVGSELLFTTESFTLYESVQLPPIKSMAFLQTAVGYNFNAATLRSFLKLCPFECLLFVTSKTETEQQCLSVASECTQFQVISRSNIVCLVRHDVERVAVVS